MMQMKLLIGCLFGLAIGVSCAAPEQETTTRIVVTEQNELGVAAIEVDRFEQNGDVFELRATNASGDQVGSVRLRIGEVAELPGDDKTGSELSVTVGSELHRQVSRAQSDLTIVGGSAPAIEQFLQIEKIVALLDREASITVIAPVQAPDEIANAAGSANPAWLNVTPLAKQACGYDQWSGCLSGLCMMFYYTMHVNAANKVVFRKKGYGACKSSSGGTCAGTACYYGPNGFNIWTIYSGSGYPKIYIDSGTPTMCSYRFYSTPQTPAFADVVGTFPNGRGCCLNGSGPCGPGLIACTSCGGGGSAGQGYWDYP